MYIRTAVQTKEQRSEGYISIKMKEGAEEKKREIGCSGAGIALQSLLPGPSRELDKHSMHLA